MMMKRKKNRMHFSEFKPSAQLNEYLIASLVAFINNAFNNSLKESIGSLKAYVEFNYMSVTYKSREISGLTHLWEPF